MSDPDLGGLAPPVLRRAYIGLGTNQGDLVATMHAALDSLKSIERSSFVAVSPYYRSAPVDASGPDFVNAVASIDTRLDPYSLMLHLLEIELMFGRRRRGPEARRNAPRSIDLDLLMVGDLIVRSTPLLLPHPRMHQRAFVLRPLADLCPELNIPGHGDAAALLARITDQFIEPLAAGAALFAAPEKGTGAPPAPS